MSNSFSCLHALAVTGDAKVAKQVQEGTSGSRPPAIQQDDDLDEDFEPGTQLTDASETDSGDHDIEGNKVLSEVEDLMEDIGRGRGFVGQKRPQGHGALDGRGDKGGGEARYNSSAGQSNASYGIPSSHMTATPRIHDQMAALMSPSQERPARRVHLSGGEPAQPLGVTTDDVVQKYMATMLDPFSPGTKIFPMRIHSFIHSFIH